MDRNYDTNSGLIYDVAFHVYRCDQAGNTLIDFGERWGTVGAERRKRVSSGGPSLPEVEKPYLRWEQWVRPVRGKVQTHKGYAPETMVYKGNLSTLVFQTGDGGNMGVWPQWPPAYESDFPSYSYSDAPPGINPDLLSQAEVKALNKLRSKSGQADLDFGLWFGERKETAQLFEQVAKGILNLAKALARKDLRKSAEVVRDTFRVSVSAREERKRLARMEKFLRRETKRGLKSTKLTLALLHESVLAYNLGVAPLVSDLQTAHQRFLTGDLTSKMAVKAVSQHARVENGSKLRSLEGGQLRQLTTLARTHGYTVTLIAVPIQSVYADMSRLGFANPVNTSYQLIGGSFLLDYVVAMGPFLEACSVPMEFTFEQGSYTHRLISLIRTQVFSPMGKTTVGEYFINFTQRRVYDTFPVPIPPLSLKGKDLSFKQHVNAGLIALSDLKSLISPPKFR